MLTRHSIGATVVDMEKAKITTISTYQADRTLALKLAAKLESESGGAFSFSQVVRRALVSLAKELGIRK